MTRRKKNNEIWLCPDFIHDFSATEKNPSECSGIFLFDSTVVSIHVPFFLFFVIVLIQKFFIVPWCDRLSAFVARKVFSPFLNLYECICFLLCLVFFLSLKYFFLTYFRFSNRFNREFFSYSFFFFASLFNLDVSNCKYAR